VKSAKQRQEEIKAMTRKQLGAFLNAVKNAKNKLDRSYYNLFLLARTGMRLGEALALRWDDIYFKGRKIRAESPIRWTHRDAKIRIWMRCR
jgi:integrase